MNLTKKTKHRYYVLATLRDNCATQVRIDLTKLKNPAAATIDEIFSAIVPDLSGWKIKINETRNGFVLIPPDQYDDFDGVWRWHIRLPERFGERCRVLVRGKMNSALVEFEDGYRVVTSRWAIRRVKDGAKS